MARFAQGRSKPASNWKTAYEKLPPDAVATRRKDRRETLGPRLPDPLLLPEENPAEYEDLLAALDRALGPRDFLEAVHCRNIANVIWEQRRLQRLRRLLVTDERRRALRGYLEEVRVSHPDLLTSDDPGVISRGWVQQDRDALQRLETIFRSTKHTLELITAHTIRNNLDVLEQLDRSMTILTLRRDKLLDHFDYRREWDVADARLIE
jgi:hypothetical protein